MAEQSTRSAGKYGGHPSTVRSEHRMANGVDAEMDRSKGAAPEPDFHRIRSKPQIK